MLKAFLPSRPPTLRPRMTAFLQVAVPSVAAPPCVRICSSRTTATSTAAAPPRCRHRSVRASRPARAPRHCEGPYLLLRSTACISGSTLAVHLGLVGIDALQPRQLLEDAWERSSRLGFGTRAGVRVRFGMNGRHGVKVRVQFGASCCRRAVALLIEAARHEHERVEQGRRCEQLDGGGREWP